MGDRSRCAITGKKDTFQFWLSEKCKFAGQCMWYNAIYVKNKKHVYVCKGVRKRSGNDNSGCLWGRKLE